MQWVTTRLLADKLGLSDRTVRDWAASEPGLAVKKDGIWQVNIRALAESRKVDLAHLLILLQSPETKLIKATALAKIAGVHRRTVAHWCKVRPFFAIRLGVVWYVDVTTMGVTLDEIATRKRHDDSAD